MSRGAWVEYACFGKNDPDSRDCYHGCTQTKNCTIATYRIPNAPVEELGEYLASTSRSVRSRAIVRLKELQNG